MPSTHNTTDQPTAPAPTVKQLRYLRDLANRLGQTFTYPATRHAASSEIARLKSIASGRPRGLDRDAARREREQTRRDLAEQFGGATAYRPDEIAGYGARATFNHASRS